MRFTHLMAWGRPPSTCCWGWLALCLILGGWSARRRVIGFQPHRLLLMTLDRRHRLPPHVAGVMIRYGRTQFLFHHSHPPAGLSSRGLAGLASGVPGASVAGLAISVGVIADAAAAGVLVRPVVHQHFPPPAGRFHPAMALSAAFYILAMTRDQPGRAATSAWGWPRPLPLESLAAWRWSAVDFPLRSGGWR